VSAAIDLFFRHGLGGLFLLLLALAVVLTVGRFTGRVLAGFWRGARRG
jgi:hypothetical protein